jgi:ABC-2 type transport system permease protein
MMKKIMVIVKKDLRETLRTKAFYGSMGIVIFVLVALAAGLGRNIGALIEQETSLAEIASAIQPLVGTTAFTLSLMLMLLFCMYTNAYTLTMEKVKHSIESLLCTPLSLRQICLGKSLAVFLPSVILGLVFTFSGIVGINQFFIAPKLGHFIMLGAAPLVAILVAVPLIVFSFASLMITLQLIITNIHWINAALIGLIIAVMFGLSPPVLKFGSASWSIVSISLGVAAVLALVTIYLSRLVTKERIVLSSKG